MIKKYILQSLVLIGIFLAIIFQTRLCWSWPVELKTQGEYRNPPLQIVSPRDGQTVYTRKPTLRWQDPAPRPRGYSHINFEVQVAKERDFNPVVLSVLIRGDERAYIIPETERDAIVGIDRAYMIQDGSLLTSGDYYWRVREKHISTDRSGDWSEAAHFRVDIFTRPHPPSIERPLPSQVIHLNDPVAPQPDSFHVRWFSVEGGINYQLQISDRSDFSNIVVQKYKSTKWNYRGTLTEVITTPLSDGQYYFRIRAAREAGWSDWNSVHFSIKRHPVVLSDPANGSRVGELRPELRWELDPEARGYILILSKNRDLTGSKDSFQLTTSSYRLHKDLEDGQTYYWQVRAEGVGWESKSPIWNFTVSMLPDIPIVTNPPAKINNLRPTITWNPVPYATYYKLELREESMSGPRVFRVYPTTTSFVCPQNLTWNKRYVWMIRACNRNRECSGTGVGWFEVVLEVQVPKPTLIPKQPPIELPLR